MSSLYIWPEASCVDRDGVGGVTSPPNPNPIAQRSSVDISFKDDVSVTLLLGVSFMDHSLCNRNLSSQSVI